MLVLLCYGIMTARKEERKTRVFVMTTRQTSPQPPPPPFFEQLPKEWQNFATVFGFSHDETVIIKTTKPWNLDAKCLCELIAEGRAAFADSDWVTLQHVFVVLLRSDLYALLETLERENLGYFTLLVAGSTQDTLSSSGFAHRLAKCTAINICEMLEQVCG